MKGEKTQGHNVVQIQGNKGSARRRGPTDEDEASKSAS